MGTARRTNRSSPPSSIAIAAALCSAVMSYTVLRLLLICGCKSASQSVIIFCCRRNEVSDPGQTDPAIMDPTAFSRVNVKSANIIGTMVVNRLNEDVGNVEDVVIDALNGRIVYAVLSFGGFFGLGEKLYAVPWKAYVTTRKCKSMCST